MPDEPFFKVTQEDAAWLNLSVNPEHTFNTNGTNGAVNLDPHTWHPINLAQRALEPPEPPTISEIIYPGRCHVWSGEPETLKSMVAMAVCLVEVRAGRHVAYIDYENGAREATARMRSLGATDDELALFLYFEPSEPLTGDSEIYGSVSALFASCEPSVIVVDSYTGTLATHQCDPNSAVDVERHHQTVIKPLMASGAATIILDHLVKNREARGRYSIGSERKIGVADIHVGFEIILPLSRGHHGVVRLRVHKDRPGYLHRPITAQARFESSEDGSQLDWRLEPAHTEPNADIEIFRPTKLMERVSRYLEMHGEPASLTSIEETVQGNVSYLRKAVVALLHDGYVVETLGPRRARLINLVRSYREDNTELSDEATLHLSPSTTPSTDSVQPRPLHSVQQEWLEQTENPTPSTLRPTPSTHSDPTPSTSEAPVRGPQVAGRGHRGQIRNETQSDNSSETDPNDIGFE